LGFCGRFFGYLAWIFGDSWVFGGGSLFGISELVGSLQQFAHGGLAGMDVVECHFDFKLANGVGDFGERVAKLFGMSGFLV
jgi:hypothetical protein